MSTGTGCLNPHEWPPRAVWSQPTRVPAAPGAASPHRGQGQLPEGRQEAHPSLRCLPKARHHEKGNWGEPEEGPRSQDPAARTRNAPGWLRSGSVAAHPAEGALAAPSPDATEWLGSREAPRSPRVKSKRAGGTQHPASARGLKSSGSPAPSPWHPSEAGGQPDVAISMKRELQTKPFQIFKPLRLLGDPPRSSPQPRTRG